MSSSASDTITHSHSVCSLRTELLLEENIQRQQDKDIFKLTREAVVISLPLAPFTEGIHVSRPFGKQKPTRRFGKHPWDPEDKLIFKCWKKEQLHRVIA